MKHVLLAVLSLSCLAAVLFAGVLAADAQAQIKKKPVPLWKKGIYAESVPEPTFKAVRYGEAKRNVLDFWQAPSKTPAPVVVFIHGGGWNGGDKAKLSDFVDTNVLLGAGVSVAAINYRLIKQCRDLDPPVMGPMTDAARAVQFIRSMAEAWNIDKARVGAVGPSAGACTSLWLAYHDDLADPEADDPVARESTRLACVAARRPQTSLDPKQMKAWIPNSKYGAHAFGLGSFDQFLAQRDRILPHIQTYSPYGHLDAGDPPTYLSFPKAPLGPGEITRDPTHSVVFGVELAKQCQKLGVPCELFYPGAPGVKHPTATEFLITALTAE